MTKGVGRFLNQFIIEKLVNKNVREFASLKDTEVSAPRRV